MTKPISYALTDEQLVEIEQAMSQAKKPEVRQRATAIRLLHLGHKPEEVAGMLAISLATVYNWHSRWRAGGVEGLANHPKSGRRAKATQEYVQKLEEALESDPSELGYEFNIWTVDRLRAHLYQQTGIRLSASRFRALLKKHDYVYRQPKHDLSDLQDAEAREAAKELLAWLKKSASTEPSSSSLWTKRP
jgi:putative transposase